VLTVVYVLNFLDRVLVYILFPPIKAELRLTDLQLALLGTTSFVIFYTLLGIPFGRMADRVKRKWLIAAGLAVWSLFSGLTGFAGSFWSLFFCRVMVGVGEATLGPAALSLLSDYFPPRMRATVQSVYSSGIAVGGGLAFFLGGQIGAALRVALGVLPARLPRPRDVPLRPLAARGAARADRRGGAGLRRGRLEGAV
jgi:MFS family permease